MTKTEKRGACMLENPPAPRVYKRPVLAYVHYENQVGEQVAFSYEVANSSRITEHDWKAQNASANVVGYRVFPGLEHDARLITLPSTKSGHVRHAYDTPTKGQ